MPVSCEHSVYVCMSIHFRCKYNTFVMQYLHVFRNTVCLFFLLVNALFVTIVFSLQQVNSESGSVSIELPCAEGGYGESIEPISMAFTAVFGVLLVSWMNMLRTNDTIGCLFQFRICWTNQYVDKSRIRSHIDKLNEHILKRVIPLDL